MRRKWTLAILVLMISPFIAVSQSFLISDGSTSSCNGQLFDTGGQLGDYSNDENHVFTICPTTPTQCLNFELSEYQIDEGTLGFGDQLIFYNGPSTSSPIISLIGTSLSHESSHGDGGVCYTLQADSCLTVQFLSDANNVGKGFEGKWSCSNLPCIQSTLSLDPNVTKALIESSLSTAFVDVKVDTIICDALGIAQFSAPIELGIEKGIILSTGEVADIPNTNLINNTGTDFFLPGDDDIDSLSFLAGVTNLSQDACLIELDVIPLTPILSFEYVFGSEEYPEYINRGFNDIFALLINGPGITDGIPQLNGQKNMAVLPSDQSTVSINNVNHKSNWEFYRNNSYGQSIMFDGLTSDRDKKSLTAQSPVLPCETYHLKMVIADVGDGVHDSGVFIAEIEAPNPQLNASLISGDNEVFEGCTSVTDSILIKLPFPTTQEISYDLTLSGTANQNIDYTLDLPNEITFLPGETCKAYSLDILLDNESEITETLIISLSKDYGCGEIGFSDIIIEIHDPILAELQLSNDTIVSCLNQIIAIGANGTNLGWNSMLPFTTNADKDTAFIDITESGWVFIENHFTDQTGCNDKDSVYIMAIDPLLNAINLSSDSICLGDTIWLDMNSNLDMQFLSWDNSLAIDDPFSTSTFFVPQIDDIDYTFIAIGTLHECEVIDSFSVFVHPASDISISANPSTSIIEGDIIELNATTSPSWNGDVDWTRNDESLDARDLVFEDAPLGGKHWYHISYTDNNGCDVSDSILIDVAAPTFIFPNAFLPDVVDPDQINTHFGFVFGTDYNDNGVMEQGEIIEHSSFYQIVDFSIYNRWGERVFYCNNNDCAVPGWDGAYKGNAQATDVYLYYFEAIIGDNRIFKAKGDLTLLR